MHSSDRNMRKWNIEQIREDETPTQVTTFVTSVTPDGLQTGWFGSVGFSQGIHNKIRGFVEVRYEKMNPSSRDVTITYRHTSFSFFTGVRF